MILLDIMLPDEDGISILKRLKSDAATAEIPVIMLSAKSSEIDKVTGLENGADDYITNHSASWNCCPRQGGAAAEPCAKAGTAAGALCP